MSDKKEEMKKGNMEEEKGRNIGKGKERGYMEKGKKKQDMESGK
jgi:hypothetical protein